MILTLLLILVLAATTANARAVQIVTIAPMVAAVLQGVKKLIPQISGIWAQLFAFAMAVVGAYALADPGQVMTLQFLITAVAAGLGAIGIHGLVKVAGNPGSTIH